jgi:hypothetical protein
MNMKKHWVCGASCGVLVLICAVAALAGDHPIATDRTPAILASLDSGGATILDDQSAGTIRGQGFEYKYVLVKILGVNALDGGVGVQWTWNPLGFRYGAWGGPGWTNGGLPGPYVPQYADEMDALFMAHDIAYDTGSKTKLEADQELVAGLSLLPNSPPGFWGAIYQTNATNVKDWVVQVSGVSLIGGKTFFLWRPMPYSEYARREALAGMGVMIAGRSLLSSIGIH